MRGIRQHRARNIHRQARRIGDRSHNIDSRAFDFFAFHRDGDVRLAVLDRCAAGCGGRISFHAFIARLFQERVHHLSRQAAGGRIVIGDGFALQRGAKFFQGGNIGMRCPFFHGHAENHPADFFLTAGPQLVRHAGKFARRQNHRIRRPAARDDLLDLSDGGRARAEYHRVAAFGFPCRRNRIDAGTDQSRYQQIYVRCLCSATGQQQSG